MPSLIITSQFSRDSQALRRAAAAMGWQTLRLDGWQIPEWFEAGDRDLAIHHTASHAFDIVSQLDCVLLGPSAGWLPNLPHRYSLRQIDLTTLGNARRFPSRAFIKPATGKGFPARVYDDGGEIDAPRHLPDCYPVLIAEPVCWRVEYRCFVVEYQPVAISGYLRGGRIYIGAPEEVEDGPWVARDFCARVLRDPEVRSPPAFVVDVGVIEGRGWAVVEANECWAAGLYQCDPDAALSVLRRACVPAERLTERDRRWVMQKHDQIM